MTAQDVFTLAEKVKAVFKEMNSFHMVYVSVTTANLVIGLNRTNTSAPSEMKVMFKCKLDEKGEKSYFVLMESAGARPVETKAGPAVSLILSEVFTKINLE